jgi:ribosome maturation factor RimP
MSFDESVDQLLSPIREHIASLGFELVDLRRAGTLDRPILQVRVDRPDSTPGHGITAEECGSISRQLERLLESRGLVGPRYVLEVSSPGIERPLRWPEHWRRYVGRRARIRADGLAGRPEVEILGVPDDEHVRLRLPDGSERTVALRAVRDARLTFEWATPAKPGNRR